MKTHWCESKAASVLAVTESSSCTWNMTKTSSNKKKMRSIEFTFTGYWYQSNLIMHWNNIALRSIATYYVRIPISDFIKKYWQKKSTKIDNICQSYSRFGVFLHLRMEYRPREEREHTSNRSDNRWILSIHISKMKMIFLQRICRGIGYGRCDR